MEKYGKSNMRYMDIWMADLPMVSGSHVQGGRRPVLIVSNNVVNASSGVISMIPLTSKLKRLSYPTHVELSDYGLRQPSMAMCEQVKTIDKSSLLFKIGHVSMGKDVLAIQKGLRCQLNLAS